MITQNPVKKSDSLYLKTIDKVFSPMSLGLLTITLPDARVFKYGTGKDGVHAGIRVVRESLFKKCFWYGDVGFGEAYVDGDWDTDNITSVIEWMILNVENHPTLMSDRVKKTPVNFLKSLNKMYFALRSNTLRGSQKNIEDHYDLGNDFFKLFLDPTMTYSSGYFTKANQTLQEAQIEKYDQICQKIRLKHTDYLLEIGSGWGGFAIHAAKNYGCHVKTITISKKQFEHAKKRFEQEGLAGKIDIQLVDYRLVEGEFDKIVSIEMIEAVGDKFLSSYFGQIQKILKKDGLVALQMILSPDHRYDSFRENVDWIQKHIFPGSLLPSLRAIQEAIAKTGNLCLYDYDDMTPSYVKTLSIWRDNFNEKIDEVRASGFDDQFIRKWNYYKSYCEAAFKMRNISVAQAVFTRSNNLNLEQELEKVTFAESDM